MGTNTIADVSDGTTADASDLNQYSTALREDFVPRNASGAATSGAGDLGTATYKWQDLNIAGNATIDGTATITGDVTIATNFTNYEPLGTVKTSILTVAQFQAIMGTNWVLMDGSSCAGSDLDTLTSISTLPNLVDGGALVQTDSDGNISNLTNGANLSHTHVQNATYPDGGGGYDVYNQSSTALSGGSTHVLEAGGSLGVGSDLSTDSSGGSDNLAAGVKMNFFIKINN